MVCDGVHSSIWEIIGSSFLKIFTNQMQLQTKKNSSLIHQNWTHNSTLDEFVKYEYQKSNKPEYIQKDLQILEINSLHFLGDWKKVTKEDKKKFPDGLKYLLDEKVGIESENVRMKSHNMEGKIESKERKNMEDIFIFHIFFILSFLIGFPKLIWRGVKDQIPMFYIICIAFSMITALVRNIFQVWSEIKSFRK
jgi:hypothetical protein